TLRRSSRRGAWSSTTSTPPTGPAPAGSSSFAYCPTGVDEYEREPKWFPLIGRSLRDGPALFPVYGLDLTKSSLGATFGRREKHSRGRDKPGRQSSAGRNPGARSQRGVTARLGWVRRLRLLREQR